VTRFFLAIVLHSLMFGLDTSILEFTMAFFST
jgi:hypothetical protein